MTKYNEAQVDFRERSKGRIQRQLEISMCLKFGPHLFPFPSQVGPQVEDPGVTVTSWLLAALRSDGGSVLSRVHGTSFFSVRVHIFFFFLN